ncbi:hypothetical protein [Paenirhodobacter populi]|nr:hypothetical protein [Sinirhodobacter populi]
MNDTPSDPAHEPEDWNFNAGVSAMHNAAHGDWTQLRARLLDPSVTLTM